MWGFLIALAGPKKSTLLMTVNVINAPITPPSSIYLWSTANKEATVPSLPVKNHSAIQTLKQILILKSCLESA